MSNEAFIEKAKSIVREYSTTFVTKAEPNSEFEVFVVWNAYILGNIKALLSTTLYDGMYYEVTYNKAKGEIYFDAYKKAEKLTVYVKE